MKKILFILSLVLVTTLTGCGDKPFESDLDGYEYTETDTISFSFNNGVGTAERFRYTFDAEYKMFINEDSTIYNFKNINDYKKMSDALNDLLNHYPGTIKYRTRLSTDFDDVVELSTGANKSDYNLKKFTHDGDVYIEDAFIVTENGVTMMISYTRFSIDGETIVVPSFIQLYVSTIHRELTWEYLGEDNEYYDENSKVISYEQIIVPLPMKTGVSSSYETLLETGTEVDPFTRVVTDSSKKLGLYIPCDEDTTAMCINPTSTILEVQIYEMSLDQVKEFYVDNYGGLYIDGMFAFINSGNTFILYETEEVEIRDDQGGIIDVVNAKIRLN